MDMVMQRLNIANLKNILGGSILPIGILILVAMMVVPLPPILLDVFFISNILVSLLILMVAMHTYRPLEFSSLMEFVLKTVISADQGFVSNSDVQESRNSSDIEQILGACLSIVSAFPEECKNNRGIVKTERILLLLEKYSDRLFGGHLPELSSTVIRDIVNHWLEKLR